MFGLIPFRKTNELTEAFRGMDDLMRRFWEGYPFGDVTTEMRVALEPRIEISEKDKEIIVKAEIPGLDEKDLDITLDNDLLVIKGEKKQEKEESGEHYHRVETTYGSFCRSVRLPAEVETGKVDATYKKGVLKIVLPKTPEATKRVTHVKVH